MGKNLNFIDTQVGTAAGPMGRYRATLFLPYLWPSICINRYSLFSSIFASGVIEEFEDSANTSLKNSKGYSDLVRTYSKVTSAKYKMRSTDY